MPFYGGDLTEWTYAVLEEELDRQADEESLEDLYKFSAQTRRDMSDYVKDIFESCYNIPSALIDVMLCSIDWDAVYDEFKNYADHNDKVALARQQHCPFAPVGEEESA